MMESSPFNPRRAFLLLGRLFLGGLLIYSGYTKLFVPGMKPHPPVGVALALFATQIDSFQLLPPWAVTRLAHTLPFVEIALGILLVIGWRLRIWSSLASVLLLGFLGVVIRSYALGLQINCGCFGPGEALTIKTVLRDAALAAVSLLLTVFAFLEARASHPWSRKVEG
ncbi:MAG TPA: MauE/DoxX family redox-associated membrane protein [Candidatus Acidoferrales bacterium]|nr:MauE/DoxX family redox-associated membrane protein [Candidatus Acidoferrales bacterium]